MLHKNDQFALANFEGPLDVLMCLIQKEELDIYDISIQELIQQFVHQLNLPKEGLERGAEFIGHAAYLVWLKSKTLLPNTEHEVIEEDLVEDPHFEIIHHLLDYCRFKQAAKELASRQEQQQSCYFRGIDHPEWKKPLGIDHVSLEELSLLFKEMISKAAQNKPQIQEENWRVCDKIKVLRRMLKDRHSFSLTELFCPEQSRLEMIVIFLAILELMKIGELVLGRAESSESIWLYANPLLTGQEKE